MSVYYKFYIGDEKKIPVEIDPMVLCSPCAEVLANPFAYIFTEQFLGRRLQKSCCHAGDKNLICSYETITKVIIFYRPVMCGQAVTRVSFNCPDCEAEYEIIYEWRNSFHDSAESALKLFMGENYSEWS